MNILKGKINEIKVNGQLSIVSVKVAETIFTAIVIDTPETAQYLKKNNPIQVIFKENEVIIGTGNMDSISLRNRLIGKIIRIDSDVLLSKLVVKTEVGDITSVITTNSVKRLKLEVGSKVTAMIKTNELILSE